MHAPPALLTQSVGKYIRRGGACAARVAEILLDNVGFVNRAPHASPFGCALSFFLWAPWVSFLGSMRLAFSTLRQFTLRFLSLVEKIIGKFSGGSTKGAS